jgi:OOP family OmpA-OmpF porin
MLTLLAFAPVALAADADVQVLRPATPGGDLVWTEPATVAPGLHTRGALHYGRNPVVYVQNGQRDAVVRGLTRLDLMGGWGVGRLQAGATVPVLVRATSDLADDETGLGDLSIDGRFAVLEPDTSPVALALVARLSLPTATVDLPLGASGPSIDVRAAASLEAGPATLGANLGIRGAADPDLAVAGPPAGSAVLLGAGAALPLADAWGVTGELAATPLLGEVDAPNTFPTELLVGGWRDVSAWRVQAGLGAAVTSGVGAPLWRGFLTVSRRPAAPGTAPDPGLDSDGDTIPDALDICPLEPETVNEIRDQDGCPEDPAVLAAEREAGADLVLEFDGDTDGDGIADLLDACPAEPEDLDTVADTDGCPEDDADADGILDDNDKCPLAAEAVNGLDDADGCPEAVSESVAKVSGVVKGITFATGSAELRSSSTPVLKQVLAVLKDNPTWVARVEGHTDDTGDRDDNLDLSARRAAAVKAWLVRRGIPADRVETVGFGPDKPIQPNDADAGRAENRRVEVHYASTRETP